MKTKKSLLAISLVGAMAFAFAGCGSTAGSSSVANTSSSLHASSANGAEFTIGICQLTQHPSLDAATQGFMDAVEEALPGQVKFDLQNASNDIPTCGVICSGFAASGVDLILANATPSLQAAAAATTEIPILGTAVTEYGVALELEDFDGTVGGNISGTCDLAPLDQQAAMIQELVPQAKTVGILYSSSEANSVYQAEVVQAELEKAGLTVNVYTFADSNDVSAVAATASTENDALYIPTDNTAASCAEAIHNAASEIPIITGDADTCRGCGIASFCIDYYELGRTTGQMAVRVLQGESIDTMPVEYYGTPSKRVNQPQAEALNIAIPEGYEPLD